MFASSEQGDCKVWQAKDKIIKCLCGLNQSRLCGSCGRRLDDGALLRSDVAKILSAPHRVKRKSRGRCKLSRDVAQIARGN